MVRPVDRQILQKVWIDRKLRMRRTGIALAVDRRDPHFVHQGADMLAPDRDAFPIEHVTQHPGAGEWVAQMQFVDPAHYRQIGIGMPTGGGSLGPIQISTLSTMKW